MLAVPMNPRKNDHALCVLAHISKLCSKVWVLVCSCRSAVNVETFYSLFAIIFIIPINWMVLQVR